MQQVGGYRAYLPFFLDYDLFLRLADVTSFRRLHGRCGYVYRRRRSSLSDQPRPARQRVADQVVRAAIRRRYGYQVPW